MMNNIVLKNQKSTTEIKSTSATINDNILDRYLAFCDSQKDTIAAWYIAMLLSLGGAFMPIAMYYSTPYDWYLPFIGVGILMFFSNILLVISEQHPRAVISTYIATIIFFTLVPLIGIIVG